MKISFVTIALVFINIGYAAAISATKTIKFKTDKVTVYKQGAQLFTSKATDLSVGENTIIFEDVSPSTDVTSIQAAGKGNFIITDIQFKVKDAEQAKPTARSTTKLDKEIKNINDSIIEISYLIEDIENRKQVLNTEKSLIVNNRLIKGDTKKDSLGLLIAAMEYYKTKINSINSELLKIKKEEQKVSLVSTRLQTKLEELNQLKYQTEFEPQQANTRAIYQIVLTINSEVATSATLNLNYFVMNAGWYTRYEIKGESNSANIGITQKAEIYQNTGIDWDNVKIKLSTSNPKKGNYKPMLSTNYLYYYNPYVRKDKSKKQLESLSQTAPAMTGNTGSIKYDRNSAEDMKTEEQDSKNTADYTTVSETYVNMEYDIKIAYNIKSDNKIHSVIIQDKDLPTKFSYSAVPKLDKDAFLMAKITNWEDLNFIAGATKIYFDGSYIGESSINPEETEDTLEINFGRDESWVIERKLLKDKSKERMINGEKTKEMVYEITLRNTKEFATEINVDDQIPLSNTNEIEVKLLESSKAKYDELTGMLKWNIKLKPKETKKIIFSYTVKYPSNKTVYNL